VPAGGLAECADDGFLAAVSTALYPGSVMTATHSTYITFLLNTHLLSCLTGLLSAVVYLDAL